MSEPEVIEVLDEDIARSTDVTVQPRAALTTPMLSVEELLSRRHKILDTMNMAMEDGVHYGKIQGVQKKSLLKPGAEMLCQLFQLSTNFPEDRLSIVDDPVSGHRDVRALCQLKHIPSGLIQPEGLVVAEAHGSCSTREKKYAYRSGALTCPTCGAPEVRKSKQQGKDEFYCWKKQGGCGAIFPRYKSVADDGDHHSGTGGQTRVENEQYLAFAEQLKDSGKRIDNPDLADQYNTVLKMAEKRALIAATLMATGASDVFTQDVEDAPGATGDSSTHEPVRRDPSPVPVGYMDWGPTVLAKEFEKVGVEPEWLAQVVEVEFGSGVGFTDLDPDQRRHVGQTLRTLFARLHETLGPKGKLEFPGPLRSEIQEVFATVLDGLVLDGPPWRMHPPDIDPSEEQYEPRIYEEPSEADDIPFGEPATS